MKIAISMLTLVLGVTGYALYAGAEPDPGAAPGTHGAHHPATAPTTSPSADAEAPVNQFCAVEGGDNKVDPSVFVMQDGKKVGFCCSDCQAAFKKDPAKYMKNLK